MRPVALAIFVGVTAWAVTADDHTPMTFAARGNSLVATGEIDANTLDAFERALDAHPEANTLILQYVGGSVDDEANVEFARLIHDLKFTTVVPTDGLVASGGTDLFLAGEQRRLEAGACVGVHSWAAENFTATDLSASDPEHDRYLDYYEDIGIDAAFYWFTLQAAPADAMHWMTSDQADRFGVSTEHAPSLGLGPSCDRR